MIHRAICLILVAILPANQAAIGFAHTHSGSDAATPHVHLPWTTHEGHSHEHHHARGHHHHGHGHHHGPAQNQHQSDDTDTNNHQTQLKRDTESSLGSHEEAVVFCTEVTFLNSIQNIDLDDSDVVAMGCIVDTSPLFQCFPIAAGNTSATGVRPQCAFQFTILLQTCCLRL